MLNLPKRKFLFSVVIVVLSVVDFVNKLMKKERTAPPLLLFRASP